MVNMNSVSAVYCHRFTAFLGLEVKTAFVTFEASELRGAALKETFYFFNKVGLDISDRSFSAVMKQSQSWDQI